METKKLYNANGTQISPETLDESVKVDDTTLDKKMVSYVSRQTLNLANASMRCDFTSCAVDALTSETNRRKPAGAFVAQVTDAVAKTIEYGIRIDGFKGYGVRCPQGEQIDWRFHPSDAMLTYTLGFWLNVTAMNGCNLLIANSGGGSKQISASELVAGYETDVTTIGTRLEVPEIKGNYAYVQIQVYDKTKNVAAFKIALRSMTQTSYLEIVNFTAVHGNVTLEPNWEYDTLYKRFGSRMVGKSLCMTGDSNGGAGTELDRRFAYVMMFLGMKLYTASVGGWSMQGRVTSNPSNGYYGWLYNHNWRSKVLAVAADIYYFNQCTNDGNPYSSDTYDDASHSYPDTITLPSGQMSPAYGRFGDGSLEEVKAVLDIYTPTFAAALDAAKGVSGALDAAYTDPKYGVTTLKDLCRHYMTTLGCIGAYIKEISEAYPKSVCVIDSTLQSIGVCNGLYGGFDAGGLSATSAYEEDANGYMVYAPYLLTNVDSDGQVTQYISNGTINGGTAVTTITNASTLTDGNNYSLYCYYAFKNYGKVVGTDTIDAETDAAIRALCHQFYEDGMGTTYGRCTPELLLHLRPDLEKNQMIEKWVEKVNVFQTWCPCLFIDAGRNCGINRWNVGRVAGDAGHYNARGHRALGIYIANQLNQIQLVDDGEFKAMYGNGFDAKFGLD